SVAGFAWNGWQLSNGIRGRLHLEYAVILEPLVSDWEWLDEIAGRFSSDFFATGRVQPELPEQPELEGAFE
ncbi:MAG: hypothetical protein OXI11_01490, partial [Gammaproteobacteria bacterium]|nr:hypothetical protein [Gammaproteobacteria bacterium]